MRNDPRPPRQPAKLMIPLRIAGIYAIVGGMWILVSDSLVLALVDDPDTLTRVQIYKGWFYVVATAFLLYLLVRGSVTRISDTYEALRTSEERLARIIETMTDGVTIVNTEGRVTFANSAAESILGLTCSEMAARTYNDPEWRITTVSGEPFPEEELPFRQVLRTAEPVYGVEHAVERPDGSRVILSINSAPLYAGGRVTGVVSSLRDITERRNAEEELERRREQEARIREEAEEAKRLFYRGTIFSMTDGKLNLLSRDDIRALLPPRTSEVEIRSASDLSRLRAAVREAARAVGAPDDRIYELQSAVGEAAANAVKHANGGAARIGIKNDVVQVSVCDRGPGIDTLVLPRATLMRRFSTVTSMGLGYSVILASVDRVYLATEKGGTCVLMEKHALPHEPEVSLENLPDTW